MYQNLEVFRTAAQMAKHAGARQAVTARNIANSDTPGYRASHMMEFKDVVGTNTASSMRATRSGHVASADAGYSSKATLTKVEASPNGNAVSLEEEMMRSVEIAREHSKALAVYRHAMTVIRTSIGR